MKRLLATVLLLATCASGCKTGTGPDADAQSEAGDTEELLPADAHDPSSEPNCCPLDSPSCDCPYIGGVPDERGECATVCNVRPEGWIRMNDDDGCFYWLIPEDAGSCDESGEDEPESDEEPEPVDGEEPGPEPPPDADAG